MANKLRKTSTKSETDPWFTDDTISASEARAFGAGAFSAAPGSLYDVEGGIIPNSGPGGGFGVQSSGTGASPAIKVSGGRMVLPIKNQHAYVCVWPVTKEIKCQAPDPSNPRIDYVIAIVRSDELGDNKTDQGFYVETIEGTPAADPKPPALPANSYLLWSYRMDTAGKLTLTDHRTFTRAVGGVRDAQNDMTRPGSYPHDLRITPRGALDMWSEVSGKWQWQQLASPYRWHTWTPPLHWAGGGSFPAGQVDPKHMARAVCRYQVIAGTMLIRYEFSVNPDAHIGVGAWSTRLPPGIDMWPGYSDVSFGGCQFQEGGGVAVWVGYCEFAVTNKVHFLLPIDQATHRCWYARTQDETGQAGTGVPKLPGAWTIPAGSLVAHAVVPIKSFVE